MHIITRKRLIDFAKKHRDAEGALNIWYALAAKNDFRSFMELRKVFSSADQVGKFTVFNIGGNKYRLIAAIHYNRKKIYIRHILTHAEYDSNKWKE
ncbi:MAG TPA: type II toxin-antitoxin system HigB family toxin [Acidiferrobacterales bacterium]|nr:type II toxin-antitoxin system HigB family toxin [Acidiferrobacterales bacterium]